MEQWEPVLNHLMDSLDFHRNSASYSMEKFLKINKLHENVGTGSEVKGKVDQENKFTPDKPKYIQDGRSKRVQANIVGMVQNPPACHICSQAHFWGMCDELKDPNQIASIAQNLADKNFCLRCACPQVMCG